MEMAFKTNIKHFFKLKLPIFAIVFLTLFVTSYSFSFASDYVLPYPSSMPGSKFYTLHRLFEKFENYWYFGNFAKFHYDLKYSDRYLVEAKTLFEYRQYLLANDSLDKSNLYFFKAKQSLIDAKNNNKDISEKQGIFKNASLKHIEILSAIRLMVPSEFEWQPEKEKSTKIYIQKKIDESVRMREL